MVKCNTGVVRLFTRLSYFHVYLFQNPWYTVTVYSQRKEDVSLVYRSELKHEITPGDKAAICANLRAVAHPDPHVGDSGQYVIRSLYFDSIADSAFRANIDGLNEREKFRLRYYNDNTALIHLEKKVKRGGLGYKLSADVTAEEVRRMLARDIDWMPTSGRALLVELYVKMKTQGLRPRAIVEYTRTPFVYAPGNVRVTVDENIRTSLRCEDFLSPDCVLVPIDVPVILLEVKWDAYLPSVIKRAVQLRGVRCSAFSKYVHSRVFG